MPSPTDASAQNAQSAPLSRRKKSLFLLLALLLGGIVGLVMVEGIAHLLFRQRLATVRASLASRKNDATITLLRRDKEDDTGFVTLHPYFGYTMRPNIDGTYQLGASMEMKGDRHGFRNGNRDYTALPEKDFVIGIFGGSSIFGLGITQNADTIAAQLERVLQARLQGGPKVRVINFGLPGWHQPQHAIAFSHARTHLDMVITCDGYNEIIVPFWNTFPDPEAFNAGQSEPLPKYYPPVYAYGNLKSKFRGERIFHRYPLTLYESTYPVESIRTRSAFYLLYRKLRTTRLEAAFEKRMAQGDTDPREYETRKPTIKDFENCVRWGVQNWVRGAEMVDALASASQIPALHCIQPFRYANPESTILDIDIQMGSCRGFFLKDKHPSHWYSMLRKRASQQYDRQKKEDAIWFLDLAETVPYEQKNWGDYVHLTPEGTAVYAEHLADFILKANLIR